MSDQVQNCKACGAVLTPGARFCTECGAPVEGEATPTPTTVSSIETLPPGGIPTPEPIDPNQGGNGFNPGDVVAEKYVIDRMVGQGGMGTVYKATEKLTDRSVALKIIRSENIADEAHVKRLINEGMTTRDLAHQNIVRVYDIGLHNQQPYIAMEFIEGKPLHVWRSEKMANGEDVSMSVIGQIVEELLNGLEVAHAAGVIHRDLKPENILLIGEPTDQNAKVKIVDFGIALATKIATSAGTGTGYGTQLYMAPEQIRNSDLATPAADLYSVSKIFYELLIGVLPTGHWQPPSGSRSDVPEAIDTLIEKGLKDAPIARPQSAVEYRDDLNAALDDVKPVIRTGKLPKWVTYAAGGVAAVMALIVVAMNITPDPDTILREDIDRNAEIARQQIEADNLAAQLEYERAEADRLAREQAEFERAERARLEQERIDRERRQREERERLERERLERERLAQKEPFDEITDFTGRWTEAGGAYYDITVSPNGQFQGTGVSGGVSVGLAGVMNFQGMQYKVFFNGVYAGEGTATRSNHCHFIYSNIYTDFSTYSGELHVRHNPGDTECP